MVAKPTIGGEDDIPTFKIGSIAGYWPQNVYMTTVYRDKNGTEYISVPLATHEVKQSVPLEARIASKRASKRTNVPFYEGTDGSELFSQPRSHRSQWSDAQWGAFEEFKRVADDTAASTGPSVSAIVIKSGDQT